MKLPQGFRAAGMAAGLKRSGKPDLSLITAPQPLAWAFVGTTNIVRAPCVSRNRARFAAGGGIRAIVVNSGSANCANGEQGARDNESYAQAVAEALGLADAGAILTASTGVIGQPLNVAKIRQELPNLLEHLGAEADPVARAIMTTDKRPKLAEADLGGARLVGIAKGSGMIHPNMATMFAFLLTDADIPQEALRELWPEVASRTFNQVTVDGDTSTNDMAMVCSSRRIPADIGQFTAGLERVCQALARMIARDGEGATKLITACVHGARTDAEARLAARAVVKSPLVKAAAHGNDPNWGRILSAIGTSGASFNPAEVVIRVQGVSVYQGAPQTFEAAEVSRKMDSEELEIDVDLGAGSGAGTAWGCDLTADYVHINADYHT